MGFEIAEQLGWTLPRHTVVPMASGSLHENSQGLQGIHSHRDRRGKPFSIHGAQASGCSPISEAMKKGIEIVKPVPNPQTIVKSLAIGTPADGYYAIRTMKETGGHAEDVSDDEVVSGIRLLANTAGIFAETAGGVTVACARKLIESGQIPRDESIVLCITGHGLKTQEAVQGRCGEPRLIKPSLREFEASCRHRD